MTEDIKQLLLDMFDFMGDVSRESNPELADSIFNRLVDQLEKEGVL